MHSYLSWLLVALSLALLGGTVDERRVYRQLREALPHHVVLAKLPLIRFCQPTDPDQVRYWYEILGANHVSFAICSANGRVLAAIDLEQDRHVSRRSVKIKQAVLAACKVRYLRCAPHEVPSLPELQLLVPMTGAAARAPQSAPTLAPVRDVLAASSSTSNSGFGSARSGMSVREIPGAPIEAGGVVSDTAGSWLRH